MKDRECIVGFLVPVKTLVRLEIAAGLPSAIHRLWMRFDQDVAGAAIGGQSLGHPAQFPFHASEVEDAVGQGLP